MTLTPQMAVLHEALLDRNDPEGPFFLKKFYLLSRSIRDIRPVRNLGFIKARPVPVAKTV